MFEISNFLKQRIAQELCGGVDLVKATSFTMKLFSDEISLEGIGTELTAPEYEQFTFANNTTNFPVRTDGKSINAFGAQSADVFSEDADYASIGVYDQSGNFWFRKLVTRTILTGEYQKIEAGDLVFEIVWDNTFLEPSIYLKTKLANELVGGVDLTKATSFKTKLFSNNVSLAGTGTEITTPEYEQFTIANNLTSFPARTDGKSILATEFESEDAFSADAGFQSIGVFDQSNNLWFRKLFAAQTIATGQKQVMRNFVLTVS